MHLIPAYNTRMHIGAPELSHHGDKIHVTVPVTFDPAYADRRAPAPDQLWYEFPAEYEPDLYLGPEPFIMALLPLAITTGEAIEVSAPVSPRFAFHVRCMMRVYAYWNPHRFEAVPLRCPSYQLSEVSRSDRGTAVMFSGGVDSFHALRAHLDENEAVPEYRLTHGIFIFQFDQKPYERESYTQALQSYQDLFQDLGLTLIPADFNLRAFYPKPERMSKHRFQHLTHGMVLASVGGLLSGGLSRLYLAASNKFITTIVYGTSLLTDGMMSSEHFEVIHGGFDQLRAEKLLELIDWPVTYDHLRVCWWQPQGVQNCGRCHKCVRTMMTLSIAGKLQAYSTFPNTLTLPMILRRSSTGTDHYFIPEHLAAARRYKRLDFVVLLHFIGIIAHSRFHLKNLIKRFLPKVVGFE